MGLFCGMSILSVVEIGTLALRLVFLGMKGSGKINRDEKVVGKLASKQ